MPDLETVLGREGKDIEERMMSASDNSQRVKIISEFLENRLSKSLIKYPGIFSCINYIIQTTE